MKPVGIDSTRALPIVAELGLELWENASTRDRDLFVSAEHYSDLFIQREMDYRKLNLPPAITVEQWAEGRIYRIPERK